jgi:transposase-like protein
MPVVTSKDKKAVIENTGHPAAHRKVRCPSCRLGYAVENNTKRGEFICQRCGVRFSQTNL